MSTVYVLGAGASKAVRDKAPLNDDMLPKVLKLGDSPRIDSIRSFIRDFYSLNNLDNVRVPFEDIFSQLDACIDENRSLKGYPLSKLRILRENMVYAICRVMQLALDDEGPTHLMVRLVNSLRPDDAIVSLNYDLFVDASLEHIGKIPDYGFAVRDYLNYDGTRWVPDESIKQPDQKHVTLLKLHGSLNWVHCPVCRSIDVTLVKKGAYYAFGEQDPLCCHTCDIGYDPIIIAPTFLKNYDNLYLNQIWQNAEERIGHAGEIVFIGYSLPDADILLRTMLTRAVYHNRQWRHESDSRLSLPIIKVVDYVQDVQGDGAGNEKRSDRKGRDKSETRQRYESLFGQIEYHPEGFEKFVSQMPESSTVSPKR